MTAPTILEFTEYESPDGEVYLFDIPSEFGRFRISETGWGTPPIEYITQRAPIQDGETVKDFFLRPRVIQLLVRNIYCDRDAWWNGRADLLNKIRPNRQLVDRGTVPGHLTRLESTGARRRLDVFIAEGPRFEARSAGRWDEWSFQEVLRFIAFDPVIYDPDAVSQTVTQVSLNQLVFSTPFS